MSQDYSGSNIRAWLVVSRPSPNDRTVSQELEMAGAVPLEVVEEILDLTTRLLLLA